MKKRPKKIPGATPTICVKTAPDFFPFPRKGCAKLQGSPFMLMLLGGKYLLVFLFLMPNFCFLTFFSFIGPSAVAPWHIFLIP